MPRPGLDGSRQPRNGEQVADAATSHPAGHAHAEVGLGLPGTLRKALCRAHAASGGDGFNGSIVKLASDDIRIGAEQIGRLQTRIGLRPDAARQDFQIIGPTLAPMATR